MSDSRPTPQSIAAPTDTATVFAWCGARFAGTRADALVALDRQLGEIIRTTTQPIVGQMRLTWWREALEKLGQGPVPAHPVLEAIAAADIHGAALASMVDGWELLLEEEVGDAALLAYARLRGDTLFAALAGTTRGGDGWALADLAAHVGDAALATRAGGFARGALERALAGRWTGDRVVGAMVKDAALAMAGKGMPGSPRRAAAVVRMRLTGR